MLVAIQPGMGAIRRMLLGLAGTVLGLAALAAGSRANEVAAGAGAAAPAGFTIHDADETLRDFCVTDADGVLWFALPGGVRWELVRSTADPAIANPGDGAFHPFDPAEVRATLAGVRFPLERVSAEIFVLPYPRRSALESAAGPGVILLAPGVEPLSDAHQHAELTHELGHVVQYALMPDQDGSDWDAYRRLRGLTDAAIFNASAPHADRPHEIFAEDFRATFGDPLAVASGSIENAAIEPPAEVAGLGAFLHALAAPALRLAAAPNPTRGVTSFSRTGIERAPLELFDLSGRRIASLAAGAAPGGTLWVWSGRDQDGRAVVPGLYFARVRGERQGLRFALVP